MTDDLSALSELYIYAAFAGYVIYATLAICMTFFGRHHAGPLLTYVLTSGVMGHNFTWHFVHFALLINALAYCRRTHKGEIQWLY